MRNVWTIACREFGAYFKSAIGYIYIIVFLLVSMFLFIWKFFGFPVAEMRDFFVYLPPILVVFIPAVTMRMWAEERRANTYELLLTFPMKTHELVLGKFLAATAFLAIALAGTFTLPITLAWMGDPDGSAIFSGYVGAFLLGTLFLAMGIFISGFFHDQIVAFVVTLVPCFGAWLLGMNYIVVELDNLTPVWNLELGTLVRKIVGVTAHFEAFTKGLIVVGDVLFFLIWTALFLFLNGLYVDIRARQGGQQFFATAAVIALVIGLLANWLFIDSGFARFDMTEEKVHTVSAPARKVLAALEVPVQVNLYITPSEKLPTHYKDLERDIADRLEEMRIASGGMMKFKTVHLDAGKLIQEAEKKAQRELKKQLNIELKDDEKKEEEKEPEESLEQRIVKRGIYPFTLGSRESGKSTQQWAFSSLGIVYKDKKEEVLNQIDINELPRLEYRIISTIFRLAQGRDPRVGVVAPKDLIPLPESMRARFNIPPQEDPFRRLVQVLEAQKYEVFRFDLSYRDQATVDEKSLKGTELWDAMDAILVIHPKETNERQLWEINRLILTGMPMLIAAQRYHWNAEGRPYGVEMNRTSFPLDSSPFPGASAGSGKDYPLNTVLKPSGLTIDGSVLMDENQFSMMAQIRSQRMIQFVQFQSGTHIVILPGSMNKDMAITSHLRPLIYQWGTAINVAEKKESAIVVTNLMSTSKDSWKIPADITTISPDHEDPKKHAKGQFPVMVLAQGVFTDAYKDKARPKWPAPPPQQPRNPFGPGGRFQQPPEAPPENEPPPGEIKPVKGRVILTGAGMMFNNQSVEMSQNLILNCVDYLALNPDLINIRARQPRNRLIDPGDVGSTFWWKFFNLMLIPLVLVGIGSCLAIVRRASRNRYTMKHIND